MAEPYSFQKLEAKWRPYWEAMGLYRTGDDPARPKVYILDFFPYPSGEGLSVGHCRNYVPTCVASRFRRMKGYNVLHPMGWDSFGLPAENYALTQGVRPQVTSRRNADNYRRQMKLVECSYDWSREFSSTDPAYYRWTQWFFLLLHRRGLAYRAPGSQWWCPKDQTILANEQVENGRCWRCGTAVTRKELEQWYFKITEYADRLIEDLETIEWPEAIKQMQRNWIGRSAGVEVNFVAGGAGEQRIPVFTTRLDTLMGVTFLAIAPEHPLVMALTAEAQREAVAAYTAEAGRRSEIDRLSTAQEKTGVFTGAHATHPISGAAVPIWVADYVLPGYGSGAVMGVPAHDTRDQALARQYELPVAAVVVAAEGAAAAEECFTGYGVLVNSGAYSGLASDEAMGRMAADLEARGLGRAAVRYKLRDWLISRQRYWGAPIPIVYCWQCGPVAVPEEQLPVLLPDIDEFAPGGDGRSPLARVESWVNTTCPQCGGPAQRETDTMDGFACSSWYFLRFTSPHYDQGPFEPAAMAYWMPVDVYVGGAEHAVMHLLYARFWTKVMHDAGLVPFVEPFATLRNQGVLHAADGARMSKSRGNVVTPDEVIARHGTDALRTFILFIGPFEGDVTWDDSGIRGVTRFLERYWRLAQESTVARAAESGEGSDAAAFDRRRHQAIQRVTGELEQFKFNTAVAALMEYLNYLVETGPAAAPEEEWRQALESFTLLLAPIAPFIAEEVWQEALGHRGESVHQQAWPGYDPARAAAEEVVMVVQVNGRVRDKVSVPADMAEEEVRRLVLEREGVRRFVDGRPVRQVIVVPGRLVNVVV